MAEWSCSGLQIRVRRFDSGLSLHHPMKNKNQLIQNLSNIFDPNDIKFDSLNKKKYRNDWSTKFESDPLAIVFPRQKEQVKEVLKLCNEFEYPIIGSGGRTGLSGGASALKNELILSFDKMNSIIDFDETSKTVLCQPGLVTENLQSFASNNNLYYPVNFSSAGSSQIGGNIATNAGGIRVIKYGLTSRYVIGMDVISGNGQNFYTDKMLIKNATGPNLDNFFIGSEGTFGLITSCRMQLIKEPIESVVTLIGFNFIASLDALIEIILKYDIEAIEFFTQNAMKNVTREFDHVNDSGLDNNYYILVESCYQDSFNKALEKIYKEKLVDEIIISSNNSQKKSIWQYRLLISESIARKNPIKFDVAVPVKNLAKLLERLEDFFNFNDAYDLVLFGHLGDGNLHINLLEKNKKTKEKLSKIENDIYSIIINLDGTISAEHGIGINKTKAFSRYGDKSQIKLIKHLKNYFDDKGILNPGKLIE